MPNSPTRGDIAAAVAATDMALADGQLDPTVHAMLEVAVLMERRAVLNLLSDYQDSVRASYLEPGLLASPAPGRGPVEQLVAAVADTNRALAAAPDGSGVVGAVWQERAVVALLCGSYGAEVQEQWSKSQAAHPYSIAARDGRLGVFAGELPLAKALRDLEDRDDRG